MALLVTGNRSRVAVRRMVGKIRPEQELRQAMARMAHLLLLVQAAHPASKGRMVVLTTPVGTRELVLLRQVQPVVALAVAGGIWQALSQQAPPQHLHHLLSTVGQRSIRRDRH